MAKFIFKMQNILNIKEKLEDQAKNRYGMALARLREEEALLQQLQDKKYGYEWQLRQLLEMTEEGLSLRDIRQLEDGIETMKYRIRMQQIAVNRANQQVEVARMQLDEAMKERKTYEKLKEKAFETFKKEVEKEERKEVDELVSFKFRDGGRQENTEDMAI